MDSVLIHLSIPQTLLNRLHTLSKQIHVELFESSTGNGSVKVNTLKQRINFNGGLSCRGKCPLSPLTSSSQSPKSPRISTNILLILPLKFLNKMVHQSVIKILTSQMRITSGSFHLKNTLLNSKK
ncbi:hypothetical protein KIW84_075944 [Lathyrus oleraceus]|uniref:Uncharacterized protein n=1 Tax=Pisum sativum TaxID=3888 RepID=A0A9D5A075_PEA|nr:hypothetical protein KIW84_075944 [Pisum sativum]